MKRIITFITTFFVISIISMSVVKAMTLNAIETTDSPNDDVVHYFIDELSLDSTTLSIRGYAYVGLYQDYLRGNHRYYLTLKGNDGARSKSYLLSNFDQRLDLSIGAITNYCGESGLRTPYCIRRVESAGFKGSIDIMDAIDDIGAGRDTDYTLYLQVEELVSGRKFETKIRTFPLLIQNDFTQEYKNMYFDLNKNRYSTTFLSDVNGVRARKEVFTKTYWSTYDAGLSHINEVLYMCTPRNCGDGSFPFRGVLKDSIGTYYLGGASHGSNNIDYTYDHINGNKTLAPGGSILAWESTAYAQLQGTFVYLTKYKKEYAGINNITTYTAKAGDKTKVEATYTNTKSNSPVYYKLCVENDCTEGTSTATGLQTITKEINATSSNRKVTFYINETYTNTPKDDETTLYASSNKAVAFTSETGSYTPDTPIKVVKEYKQKPIKYKETITYTNPQNYLLTNGDYKGAELIRQTNLKYSSTGSNGTIYNSTQQVKNTISSPNSTYQATYIKNTSSELSTEDTIYIPFVSLGSKLIKTAYTGVGINNMTIVLQTNYSFENLSIINKIDSHTTKKTENSNIKFEVDNLTDRPVKYYIYYDNEIIKEGQEQWKDKKTFNIDDYIVSSNSEVKIILIESNGVTTSLTSDTYVADESIMTLENEESYTPKTPIRVVTTQNDSRKYYETIKLITSNLALELKSGEGFTNKLQLEYTNTSDDTVLNINEMSAITTFPEKESTLKYVETNEGVLVPLELTSGDDKVATFELPNIYVEKQRGALYMNNKDLETEGLDLLDGGRKWYTKMTAEKGIYDYVDTINHIGVNSITIKHYGEYEINGSLLGNEDSAFKVVRVQNPSNPNYTWHKTYTLSELLKEIELNKKQL